jgi:hypothetical protein
MYVAFFFLIHYYIYNRQAQLMSQSTPPPKYAGISIPEAMATDKREKKFFLFFKKIFFNSKNEKLTVFISGKAFVDAGGRGFLGIVNLYQRLN